MHLVHYPLQVPQTYLDLPAVAAVEDVERRRMVAMVQMMDMDQRQDTNNNCEVICRVLEEIYQRYKGLPLHATIHMDNTCRENLNQKMFKFLLKNRF